MTEAALKGAGSTRLFVLPRFLTAEHPFPWLFPAAALMTIFGIYPLVYAIGLSFFKKNAATRKMVLDKGALNGVVQGSPVMDEQGILGQITRVHPLVSEITLVTDREHSIPVLNTRTSARGVAFGESGGAPLLELRYMATNADIEVDDVLTTSGVDGVYPPGIPVAKVVKVERRADSVFARILCESLARVQGARHVMVLAPVKLPLEPSALDQASSALHHKGGRQ